MSQPTAPLVFLDTETDDLDPRTRQPWDVALIVRDADGDEVEHQFYVELDLSTANSFALNVGHFWDRHPAGRHYSGKTHNMAVPFDNSALRNEWDLTGQYLTHRAAAERIARLTHGAHIVGAIPSFDTITLEPLLWAHQLIPMWHYHIVDVEALAVGYMQGRLKQWMEDHPDADGDWKWQQERLAPPWKSETLSTLLDIEPPTDAERHTALGDARWAKRIYDTVMGNPA